MRVVGYRLKWRKTDQGEYKGFEDDELIFGLEGQEIYVPLNTIKNIE